jgi:hypothetical protein
VCKVEDVVDIDARQVNDGCIGLRLSAPPVQVMIYNTRALVLEDFVRLLRKLTERRKIGTSVRFRCSPEQVLESQRIERETVTNGSINSAVLPANVANVLGGFYMQASASYAGAAIASTRTSPSASAAQHASSAEATPSQPLKAALDVRLLRLCIDMPHLPLFINPSRVSSAGRLDLHVRRVSPRSAPRVRTKPHLRHHRVRSRGCGRRWKSSREIAAA